MRPLWRNQRGVTLITAFVFAIVLALVVAAFLDVSTADLREVHGRHRLTKAFAYAEAGLHKGLWMIITPPPTGGGIDYSTPVAGVTEAFEDGSYNFIVEKSGNDRTITSKGTFEGLSRTVQQKFRVTTGGRFNFAVFGDNWVHVKNKAVLDSYDSREGGYGAGTARQNGDAGTNGKNPISGSGAHILVEDDAQVKGDGVAGAGSDPAAVIVVKNDAVLTGAKIRLAAERTLPAVVIPPEAINKGTLHLEDDDVRTLAGGVYKFSGIRVTDRAKLRFTGPATIYVDGNFRVDERGKVESFNLSPPNLIVNIKGDRSVRFGESGDDRKALFYGGLYAPESAVVTQAKAEVFGALTALTTRARNRSKIHYDEAIRLVE